MAKAYLSARLKASLEGSMADSVSDSEQENLYLRSIASRFTEEIQHIHEQIMN
jgi:hypothetical protein